MAYFNGRRGMKQLLRNKYLGSNTLLMALTLRKKDEDALAGAMSPALLTRPPARSPPCLIRCKHILINKRVNEQDQRKRNMLRFRRLFVACFSCSILHETFVPTLKTAQ